MRRNRMFDLRIRRGRHCRVLNISNCDKDGSLVVKRLASLNRGVSDTRTLAIHPEKVRGECVSSLAKKVVDYYGRHAPQVDTRTIVMGSAHRTTLYVAEVLDCMVLPLQFISWADNWQQATEAQWAMVGWDDGVEAIWLWNKVVHESHLPRVYLKLLQGAEHLVLVRSTNHPEGMLGRYANLFVCRNILHEKAPNFVKEIQPRVRPLDSWQHLRQWEWGLPDATIAMLQRVWRRLGKPAERLTLIQDSASQLYVKTVRLWQEYLRLNQFPVRGLAFNAYWVAHPFWERSAGLIPVPYYSFAMLENTVRELAAQYEFQQVFGFVNDFGQQDDVERVQRFWQHYGWEQRGDLSIGPDCQGGECRNVFGDKLPLPSEQIAQRWLREAPYRDRMFMPLTIAQVRDCFA